MPSATTTYSMVLGSLLKQRWEEQGMNQQDFFEASGIATGSWSRIMRGQAHMNIEDIRAACAAVDYDVSELTSKADGAIIELEREEDIIVADKDEIKEKGSLLPAIIAATALGFLLFRLLKK
ncbi:MAG: helix-turn-helix transcriptional regulator [Alphaproteobacteria bacterium]